MTITVVAVHGNGGGAFRFSLLPRPLADDVELRAVTLPGFEGVPLPDGPVSVATFADALAARAGHHRRPACGARPWHRRFDRPRCARSPRWPRRGADPSCPGRRTTRRAPLPAGDVDTGHAPVRAVGNQRVADPRHRLAPVVPGNTGGVHRPVPGRVPPVRGLRTRCSTSSPPSGSMRSPRSISRRRCCGANTTGCSARTRPPRSRRLVPRSDRVVVPDWGHFPMIDDPGGYATRIAHLATSLLSPAV